MTQSVQAAIELKLAEQFQPIHLSVENESHMHSVPPNSETHFKVVIVSEQFQSKRAVARHQSVYQTLSVEMAGPIHALAIHTYTPEEWAESDNPSPNSPNCMGGSKRSGS